MMEGLEFIRENWSATDELSQTWIKNMQLPDFRGEMQECWHLRGRAWRWLILRTSFDHLQESKEYELSFWAEFDYYSNQGTRCFITLYEDWESRVTYDIHPYSLHAVKKAGDWYLYRYTFKLVKGCTINVEITSFEANISIMQAKAGDELDELVTDNLDQNLKETYYVNQELPFKEYAYLEQRMVISYSNLLTPFHPCEEIAESSQLEYYEFVTELYDRLFHKPEDFFTKLYEDDAHPNRFNCREYGKPELKIHMKKDRDKIEALFQLLILLWSEGDLTEDGLLITSKLSKSQKSMLTYMNFEVNEKSIKHIKYPKLGQAMKYLAGKEKPLWSFMYCWFDSSYPYLEKAYERFYDKEQYQRLIGWLKENHYQTSIGSPGGLTLDYYKCISKSEKPIGYAIHGDKFHYGFTFESRPESRVMYHCEPRIIQYTSMLNHYDELSENTKHLILQRTKQCDGCRYCVQTDKTGKRPLAAMKLVDGTHRCPYYPGFTYTFESLSKDNVDHIIAFLTDLEQIIIEKN